MPELGPDMYCSQQIAIPPTFPYLLRQFAKAAIRTQPSDLLKWATTYFRCLSLNLPPPVKPRLEYPIPAGYNGLTPGWLRALIYQLKVSETVTFKVLWDRWIGACLLHEDIIRILCLGGFDDNQAIPWLKFIALCAGHLTPSLTDTMILICEILTQEPEGGSSMIPIEIFMMLYNFLANIDASKPQVFKNLHFQDSVLDLWRERREQFDKDKQLDEEVEEEEESEKSVELVGGVAEKDQRAPTDMDVVSCPSIGDDYQQIEDYLKDQVLADEEAEDIGAFEATEGFEDEGSEEYASPDTQTDLDTDRQKEFKVDERAKIADMDDRQLEQLDKDNKEVIERKSVDKKESIKEEKAAEKGIEIKEEMPLQAAEEKTVEIELPDTKFELKLPPPVATDDSDSDEGKKEEKIQVKMETGTEEYLEKSASMDSAIRHFSEIITSPAGSPVVDDSQGILDDVLGPEAADRASFFLTTTESSVEVVAPEPGAKVVEDILVDAIPGIGGIVPQEMIDIVQEYMERTAAAQHGMVMPRNIRHYNCPPLEVLIT